MDKYDVAHDHYCYADSNVLKNLLNIKDYARFEEAERAITNHTFALVQYSDPPYDLNHFKSIHKTLFAPLYEWAGEIRNVDISKGGTRFCTWTRIEPEINKLFKGLGRENWLQGLEREDLCSKLAEYYCEFNMIHPFREGNGRVQRIFFEHLAALSGYQLNWTHINKPEWIQANIDGRDVDYTAMEIIFKRILKPLD